MKKLIYFMIIPVILLTSGMLSGCGSSKKSTDGGLVNGYNINLASLEISAGALTPAFDQTVTGYSAEVANNIPSITATPESADPKAAITVNGTAVASGSASSSIALAAGTVTTITITVTAPDNVTAKSYTLSVRRLGVSEYILDLSNLTLSSGALTPAFDHTIPAYTVSVDSTVSSITVTPTVYDTQTKITVNGTSVNSGNASGAITLPAGATTLVTIKVSTPDNSKGKDYILSITRPYPSAYDLSLSNLVISNGALTPGFNASTTIYNSEHLNGVSSITVTPTVLDNRTTITVNGATVALGSASSSVSLVEGAQTMITVKVTAPDATSRSYTIVAYRYASGQTTSANCLLSSLSLSTGTFSGMFDPETTSYRAEVDSTITEVKVTSIASASAATIAVNSVPVNSGSASQSIPVSIGKNFIYIDVTASDGVSKKRYTIECVKLPEKSKSAFLAGIYLSAGQLTPVFSKTTYSYTAEVAQNISNITVTPASGAVNETIKVNGTAVTSGSTSGAITLATGANTITVETTSEDGTGYIKYTVVVTKLTAPSTNSLLSGIEFTSGKLTPAFSPSVTSYTLVTNLSTVSVTPTTQSDNATMTVNGTASPSGVTSMPVSAGGTFTIVVTAENGATKTYTVATTSDTTAPTMGVLSTKIIEPRYAKIGWTAASDDFSAAADLRYTIYKSTGSDISTIANAETNGTILLKCSGSTLECVAAHLSPSTAYSFVVIVEDEAGNKAISSVLSLTTTGSFKSAAFYGSVRTIVPTTDTIYVGGSFTSVGINAPYSAIIDSANTASFSSDEANDWIQTVIPDGEGGWYIGGYFTKVCGVTRNFIAHILYNGSVDDWNPNANGSVYSIALNGTTVYVGGYFTAIGSQSLQPTRNNIAALDAADPLSSTYGNATAWNPNANHWVGTIAVSGSTVYAGGVFNSVNGSTVRNYIAAFNNTDGTVTAWNPMVNSFVRTIAVSGATVYACGDFTSVNGSTARKSIAAFNNTDGTVTAWNPNSNGTVETIAVNGTTVYAGGYFTSIGSQLPQPTRNCIAALDADPLSSTYGNATAWDPNMSGGSSTFVYTIAISGTTVYAGGGFMTVNGSTVRNNVAAFNNTDGTATTWDPNTNGTVIAIAVSGSTVYAGGEFTSMGSQTRNNIVAIDAASGAVTTWNPNANNTVETIVVSGSTVYAGGVFNSVNGSTVRNYIASFDNINGTVTEWNPNANSAVHTIAVSGTTVYAGGEFTTVNGSTVRNNIASFDTVNGTVTTWNPNANSLVKTIAVSGTTVYAGGYFTAIGSQPSQPTRHCIAALDADPLSATYGNATAWDPDMGLYVYAVAVSGSTIYAGGLFSFVNGLVSQKFIAAFNNTDGTRLAWNPNPNGPVNTIALSDSGSIIYAGGQFTSVGGQTRNNIAAIDTASGAVTAWDPNANRILRSIAVSGSTVYAGGSFTSIGDYIRPYFAAIDAVTGLPK